MFSKGNLDTLQKPAAPKQENGATAIHGAETADMGAATKKDGAKKAEGSGEAPKGLQELTAALEKARENLAEKKALLKEYEMLFVGTLKGVVHGDHKAKVKEEYEDAFKKYQEARAAYVVGDVSRLTEERMKLAQALAEAKGGGKEHFLYTGYKWLGEQNVAKLFGETFGWKVPDTFQKDHPLVSATLRVAGQFLSVRTALSMGLLGAGFMAGVGSGLALGMGIVAGRAFMRGIGTAAASHDMLKLIGAAAWESKGKVQYKKEAPWYQKISLWEKLTPEEIGTLRKEDIEERLANMEANALVHGKKVGESDVYKHLLSAYEGMLKQEIQKNGEAAITVMRELSEAADAKRDTLAREKRIKHQTIVGVLAAVMVVLPGIHQFQRVIEKNAGEWAAVTQKAAETAGKAGDVIFGEPAQAKVPDATASMMRMTMGAPGDTIVEPHVQGNVHMSGSEQMSRMTMGAPGDTIVDGHDTYEMVRGLKDKAVQLAIAADAQAEAKYQLSIEDLRHIRNIASRASEDGRQMKSLLGYIEKKNLIPASHIQTVALEGNHTTVYGALQEAAREHPDYFKETSVDARALEIAKLHGVTVEQLKILPHAGENLYISKAGVIITQEKMLVGQTGDVTHAHEAVAGARSHVGGALPTEHTPRSVHREAMHHVRSTEHIQKASVSHGDTHEELSRGTHAAEVGTRSEIVIEEKNPATGALTQEKIRIQGTEVHTEKTIPRLEIRSEVAPAAHEPAVAAEAVRVSPTEIFAKGFDSAHATEFAAAAHEHPTEFLKFYQHIAGTLLDKDHLKLSPDQIKMAVADQAAGTENVKKLMKAAADFIAHKPVEPLKLEMGGVVREFSLSVPKGETVGVVAKEVVERLSGKVPVQMEHFYGGKVTGSVQFEYDGQHHPIGYTTNARFLGVESWGDLQNKYFYHGLGSSRFDAISEHLTTQGKHIDISLLSEQLERYNKQIAFDMRLYADLTASGHKPEADLVLKGAKDILVSVRAYGMDDQLINTANLPPELR